jgi:5-methylcytosine-specific restriction endonuclease McrA
MNHHAIIIGLCNSSGYRNGWGTAMNDKTNRPFIYRGKARKYLYEHTCFCCEQVFLSTMKRMIYFCPVCLENKRHIYASLQVKHNIQWKCAYCGVRPYRVLEHFIPIGLGGGTTADNVLPACSRCNSTKSLYHPQDALQYDVIKRITIYFQEKTRCEVAV